MYNLTGVGISVGTPPQLPDYVEDLISQLRHVRDLTEFDQRVVQKSQNFLRDTGEEL